MDNSDASAFGRAMADGSRARGMTRNEMAMQARLMAARAFAFGVTEETT